MKKSLPGATVWLLLSTISFQPATAAAATNPVVACASTTIYAPVTDPQRLSFAPDGTLYTGRDNSGSGGGNDDAVLIHRVGPGGTPVTQFGTTAIRDPDAVVFDTAGIVSGIPGSVIVGGVDTGVNGRISRIAPDGTVTTLFGPSPVVENPSKFVFTAPGRLLFTDYNNDNVVEMTNATPQVFFASPDPLAIALDGLGRILVSSGTAQQVRLYSAAGVLLSNVFVTAKALSPLARGPGGTWGTNVFFVATNGNLRSVSPAGVVTEHGIGFAPFEDMEFGPDGALYLSDFESDVVLRVSPPECLPTLNIAPLPGAVRLTWTTNATGYLLETNTALTQPAGWGVLASNYNTLSTNYVVTNVINSATKFYRLHRP